MIWVNRKLNIIFLIWLFLNFESYVLNTIELIELLLLKYT
jgi:hypothetical protein